MRNISVPTNDTMIYAVHGNTVDECIADCAKLMAYLTANFVPENAEDKEDEHPDDCYCSYDYEDEDDTVDDEDIFDEAIDNLYFRIKNFSDIDFAKFVFELYIVRILEDFSDAKKSLSDRECIYNYLDKYINLIGECGCIDYLNCIIDNL